jgi:Uma2 family endonuclease
MSLAHLGAVMSLRNDLLAQLDGSRYLVLTDTGRLRRSSRNYFIPDLSVVPSEMFRRHLAADPAALAVFDEPLPLVAEVWSPSTGSYDVDVKIPEYRRRGDLEIWRLHPLARTLTVWRRQPDGGYAESTYQSGLVGVASLPGVTIDLDALFDFR